MKLVTRSQWGARAYRQPSGGITYSRARRGVKLHYLGTAYSDRPHDRCDDYIRQLQASHMDGNGWSDIGYSFMVCTHGAVYEGRGLRRRNSANGNTALNEECYAVLLLVGSSGLTKPTDAQLHGARDAIDYCRKEGPAGTWLGGHRDGYATSCPGDAVYAWAKAGAPRPSSSPTPSEEDAMSEEAERKIASLHSNLLRIGSLTEKDSTGRGEIHGAGYYLAHIERDTTTLQRQVADLATKVDQLQTTGLTGEQIDALAAQLLDRMSGRLAE